MNWPGAFSFRWTQARFPGATFQFLQWLRPRTLGLSSSDAQAMAIRHLLSLQFAAWR